MKTYIVCGSGEQRLQCGIDLDILVHSEDEFLVVEDGEGYLVFKDKNGVEVRRFLTWKNYYVAGVVDDTRSVRKPD